MAASLFTAQLLLSENANMPRLLIFWAVFLMGFVENENLSADQIAELRKILDENETKPETQKS